MSSQVSAALIAAGVALATSLATFYLQRARLRYELRTEFMAEAAIVRLLRHETWKRRSFMHIRARIGGFEDNELRRLLVRSGAVRFTTNDVEYWGLVERNLDRLNVGESSTGTNEP